MSKKHKKFDNDSLSQHASANYGTEYRIIKHDLIKVIVLNLLYLAGVLALYFSNLKSHFLEQWFDRFLRF